MYYEDTVNISKAANNGYLINVRVRKKKTKGSKGELCCNSCDSKTLIAKDVDELKVLLDDILPKLKEGAIEEDEFAKAFGEIEDED